MPKAKNKVDLARWKPHLEAAKREGMTIARYAKEQGLSRHTLYAASQLLRAAGESGKGERGRKRWREPAAASAVFAEARLPFMRPPAGTRIEAQWANGAKLALESDAPAQELLRTALAVLSRRR